MSTPGIEITTADPRRPEAIELIRALSEELARRYDYADDGSGDFKPEDVLSDRSIFVIGRVGDRAVACGAFRPLEDNVAEIKRMFVVPEHRGCGYSKAILAELEQRAREYGYTTVRLETGDLQPEAIGLYERSAYVRIPNYGIYVDSARSVCFEKQLFFDFSPIVPEAQPIVRAAVDVYLKHLGQWCIGMVIHGSALKGGYIPGCSDIDLQIYLEPAAFSDQGDLPLERCIVLHRALARIDPAPFHYIQGYALRPQKKEGQTGLIPGAYHVITGRLPVPLATEDDLQAAARQALENLQVSNIFSPQELLQHGHWKLAQRVRWLCTDVWPMLYHMLTIQRANGLEMWSLPKHKAMELLPEGSPAAQNLLAFYQAICRYYPAEVSVEDALNAIEYGVAFLQSVKLWWGNALIREEIGNKDI